jgi:hypothetical protein
MFPWGSRAGAGHPRGRRVGRLHSTFHDGRHRGEAFLQTLRHETRESVFIHCLNDNHSLPE